MWVTSPGPRADSLRASGQTVRVLPRLDRGRLNVARAFAGVWLAVRERPRFVVTSGAGLAVPFCLVARLLGAHLIFIETMARVSSPSATGKLLKHFAHEVFVQWPDLIPHYPSAICCSPAKLEGVGEAQWPRGAGTFVSVGSHDAPFPRMLRAVSEAAHAGTLPSPVYVQFGVGQLPDGPLRGQAWLSPDEFERHVAAAEVVVCHGGAGAMATALRSGRTPIVMARSAAGNEHVDDHQGELVERLANLHLIKIAAGDEIAATLVEQARRAPEPIDWSPLPHVRDELEAALRRAGAIA